MLECDEETLFKVTMQYVEIYNEQIKDLLNPSDANLDVREVPSKGTFVAGATEKLVVSASECMQMMHEGNLYRTVEATACNEVSSRSHAVAIFSVCPGFSSAPATGSAARRKPLARALSHGFLPRGTRVSTQACGRAAKACVYRGASEAG